jgi:hypothetical protein
MALAALKQILWQRDSALTLRDRIQVWFHFRYHHDVCKSDAWHRISTTAIAVSKLCCPVCWELLRILRNDGNFHVDGYHRNPYSSGAAGMASSRDSGETYGSIRRNTFAANQDLVECMYYGNE